MDTKNWQHCEKSHEVCPIQTREYCSALKGNELTGSDKDMEKKVKRTLLNKAVCIYALYSCDYMTF